ncbi:Heterokaryon incompatibility domain-containing protein [Madurella fahalii]|uniref:Heterokaryon incompatibility domain-containing protein n=1 Tax=Madurella fahalii TaxID=1157608 RepID=A0ABQ0G1V8_9PEZI
MSTTNDTLCSPCAALDIPGAIQRLLSQESDTLPLQLEWHGTMAAVDESSSLCALCKAIMQGWQWSREVVVDQAIRDAMFNPNNPPPSLHDPVSQIPTYRTGSKITFEIVRRAKTVDDGQKRQSSLFLRVRCGPSAISSFDVLDPVTAELRIVWEGSNDDSDAALHTDAPVSADPLSQQSLDVVRGWLETCVNSHGSACNPEVEGWMPTRLLEVVPSSNQIYLQESQALASADDFRFVALSHCWGQGGTPFTTTHQTLSLRMQGIDITELPQTFRDSVTLMGHLGLRYLWIDSLCIIQDDADDWARESAQMANVYHNAHLVLNAASSPADTMGFLYPRDIPDTARLPTTSMGRQQLSLQLLPAKGRRWYDPEGPDSLAKEPVSVRAWCLQERYLPVRALQYGSHQAFWECERMRASEGGDGIAQNGSRLKQLCHIGNVPHSVFARPHRDPYLEGQQNVNWVNWYRMIEDYMARSITKSTDRLPALSGLAQAVAQKTGGEYMAGLWKSGLLEGLLWCKAQVGEALAAPPEYVAPSWSWASVASPVQFPIYTWYTQRARWKARMADFEPLAEYVSHSTLRKDTDLYGRLKGGRLSLKAPLLPVLSIRPRQPTVPELRSLFGQTPARSDVADIVIQMKTPSGKFWIEGGLDNPEATSIDKARLSVAFLTRLPHVIEGGFIEHRFGLILEELDGGYYRRVGVVDGVILKKSTLATLVPGRGIFTIAGYPFPQGTGEIDEDGRDNDLASDPLELGKVEVTIC